MTANYTNSNRIEDRAQGAFGSVYLVLLLVLTASYPAMAQAQCGQGQGKGTDINTCADELLNAQERTLDLLVEMTQEMGAVGLLQADQMDAATRQLGFMRRSHTRGRNEKDDATAEEFETLVVKGEAGVCEFRLLPRFAMGPPPRPICTDDEIAENQCEEVCEFSESGKERNNQRGLRLEEDLADALEQTKIINDELNSGMGALASLSFKALSADEDPCGFNSPHPNVDPFPPGLIMFSNQAVVVQDTITAVGKSGCQQDAAGFNASTACIVLDVLNGVQKGINQFVNTINGNFTSAKVDATFECAKALKVDSDNQGDQLNVLEGKVDDVKDDIAEVRVLLDEVMLLLSTPQGRRENFPAN